MPLTAISVGWAVPTMLEKLIIVMVGTAHPTFVENSARSHLTLKAKISNRFYSVYVNPSVKIPGTHIPPGLRLK
jgi:hypothetical protein